MELVYLVGIVLFTSGARMSLRSLAVKCQCVPIICSVIVGVVPCNSSLKIYFIFCTVCNECVYVEIRIQLLIVLFSWQLSYDGQVQNLIERCLQLYMSQKEVVGTLLQQAKIEPGFTELGTVH